MKLKKKTAFIAWLATAPVLNAVGFLALFSVALNLLLETLGRHSLIRAGAFFFQHPLMYLYNTLIILFTLSVCLLFKRRLTALLFMFTVWLALGVTNCIVLLFRASPLSAIDFLIVKAALGMFSVYLTVVQVILIAVLAVAFVTGMVLLYIKCPKCRVSYKKSLSGVAVIGITLLSVTALATGTHALDYESTEIADAYGSFGFAYCFTRSLVSHGVQKPGDYSPGALKDLKDSLETDAPDEPDNMETEPQALPNVIYVQLESFFDVSHVKALTCSEDPIPTFTSLKANGVSGYLRMANVGGGTANSEFEILTGMNLDHFGFGEFPFTTVLKSRACESMAFNLKQLGYTAHAVHNHTAVFYNRNIAYSNLGFDTFTPVEMMTGMTYNPLGWEHDSIMTKEILAALDATDGSDFIFGVTVQGHGKYPSEPTDADEFSASDYLADSDESRPIKVSGIADPEQLGQYAYYVNQLRETDDFIADLLAALTERGEPCVVVFYGDHMPALSLTEEDITNGDLYQTEYTLWTNTDILSDNLTGTDGDPNTLDRDLEAYMLSAYVQQLCGYREGDIATLHQRELAEGVTYDDELKMLEYAQLYDDTAPAPYQTAELTFGTHPITMTGWVMSGNTLYISGDGFNKYSKVKIGGYAKTTRLIDIHTLAVDNVYFDEGVPEVVQTTDDGTELYIAK